MDSFTLRKTKKNLRISEEYEIGELTVEKIYNMIKNAKYEEGDSSSV